MRWISGIATAVVVIVVVLYLPKEGIQGIVVLLSMLGLKEYYTLTQGPEFNFIKGVGIFMGGSLTFTLIFFRNHPDAVIAVFLGILFLSFLVHLGAKSPVDERFKKMVFFYFGILYTAILFSAWGWVREAPNWRFWVFLMLASTFLADVGGYIFGRRFGKTKLAPILSPGKTVEGFLGGVLLSWIGAIIVRFLFFPSFSLFSLTLISLMIALVGPLGDLSESLIKRGMHAKDSGNLIPGHGGLLDRVDALLFTGPVVYYFSKYFS